MFSMFKTLLFFFANPLYKRLSIGESRLTVLNQAFVFYDSKLVNSSILYIDVDLKIYWFNYVR